MASSIQESKDVELLADDDDSQPRRPRRSNSWETKNAIIYDATTQTLSKQKKANLNIRNAAPSRPILRKKLIAKTDDHTPVQIPRRAKSPLIKDRVRLSMANESSSIDTFLANVKLDNLGLWVAIQRYWGNIDEIWVKGVPSANFLIAGR